MAHPVRIRVMNCGKRSETDPAKEGRKDILLVVGDPEQNRNDVRTTVI